MIMIIATAIVWADAKKGVLGAAWVIVLMSALAVGHVQVLVALIVRE